jgi:hypothetical protein
MTKMPIEDKPDQNDDIVVYDETEYEDECSACDHTHVDCPACGGVGALLGGLGNLTWFRCVHCGTDFSRGVSERGM